MSILSKLLPPYQSVRSAAGVKWSDKLARIHYGVLYEFARETDEGVQIRVSNADVYQDMETGEVEIIQRTDSRTEWYSRDDRREWPEQVERVQREGYVWHSDLRDGGLPPLRGSIISHSPRSLWRFADDDIEPPRERRNP